MSRKFAVFDIDGTLIRWQLYHALVHELAKQGALGKHALEALNTSRLVWKKREDPMGWKNYERQIITVYEDALSSLASETFDKAVQAVLDEYRDQTYIYTRDLIKKLKSEGYFLLIISGSHHELIEPLADYYGFDDWIGSQYFRRGGRFSGKKHIPSMQKDLALKDFVTKHKLTFTGSMGIGDSGSDIAMLELVEQPIAFNPDKVLLETARKHGWKVVVERKNVVYELEAHDGSYILA